MTLTPVFRIWDPDGHLIFDAATMALGKWLGHVSLTGNTTVTDARFLYGTPFWHVLNRDLSVTPTISVTGDTLEAVLSGTPAYALILAYGVM